MTYTSLSPPAAVLVRRVFDGRSGVDRNVFPQVEKTLQIGEEIGALAEDHDKKRTRDNPVDDNEEERPDKLVSSSKIHND